jgi:hypothetical protein
VDFLQTPRQLAPSELSRPYIYCKEPHLSPSLLNRVHCRVVPRLSYTHDGCLFGLEPSDSRRRDDNALICVHICRDIEDNEYSLDGRFNVYVWILRWHRRGRVDHTLYAPICKSHVKSGLHSDIFYNFELEIGAVRLELIEEKVGCGLGLTTARMRTLDSRRILIIHTPRNVDPPACCWIEKLYTERQGRGEQAGRDTCHPPRSLCDMN